MRYLPKLGIKRSQGWGLNGLTHDELETIHNASLRIFQDVGIRVDDCPEALEIFAAGGCRVERHKDHGIVKIPAYVVEDCIGWAPATTTWKGRHESGDYIMEPRRSSYATFGEMIHIIDPKTRELRTTTMKDSGDIARLCDAMPECGIVQRPVASMDMPMGTQPIYNAVSLFENTSKHVLIGPMTKKNFDYIARMAFAHVGGKEKFADRPMFSTIVCPTSPLRLEKDCAEMIIATARLEGCGLLTGPVPLSGASTPVTLAGAIVCANCECLAGLILAQLTRKGTPTFYSQVGTIMDMRLMTSPYGAPEMPLMSSAIVQLAHHYKLPSHCTGIHSDSKCLDAQMGYESAIGATTMALSGANIINGLGSLELGLTFDYAKFMMDIECARSVRMINEGVNIDEYEVAEEVIHAVKPGGQFLAQRHTFDNMKRQSGSPLFCRRTRRAWEELPMSDIVDRAYAAANEILENHEPTPVSDDVKAEVAEIVAEYEAEREK
ncbi:MAG: trimethylamine methyltransferase family protein [Desulfobacterales bacterium]|nr:trimethylamine methyltransferase family protein [Desulfobacterales bacterium]